MSGPVPVQVDDLVDGAKHVPLRLFVPREVQQVVLLLHQLPHLRGVLLGDVRLRGVDEGQSQGEVEEVEALVGAKALQYLVLVEILVEVLEVEGAQVVWAHHAEVVIVGGEQVLDGLLDLEERESLLIAALGGRERLRPQAERLEVQCLLAEDEQALRLLLEENSEDGLT